MSTHKWLVGVWSLTSSATLEDYIRIVKGLWEWTVLGILLLGIYPAKMNNYRILGTSIFTSE